MVYVGRNLDEFWLSIWSNILVPNGHSGTQTRHLDDVNDAKHFRDVQHLRLLQT
jgi:hypothetical protein